MKHDPISIQRSRDLRRDATSAETVLWRELRNRRFARFKFRRQQPFRPFILDSYCAKLTLAIELDGESHHGREAYDAQRQSWIESRGVRVIRIFNVDLSDNLDGVMEQIERECSERMNPPTAP